MEKFSKTAGTNATADDDYRQVAALLLDFFDMEDEEDQVTKMSEIFAAEEEDEEVRVEKIVHLVMSGDIFKLRPVDFVRNLAIFLAEFFGMDQQDTAEEIARIVMPEPDGDIDIDLANSVRTMAVFLLRILEMRGEEEEVIRERIQKAVTAKDGEADDDCYEIDTTNLYRMPAVVLLSLFGMEKDEEKVRRIVAMIAAKVNDHGGDGDDECCEVNPIDFARKLRISDSDDLVVVAEKGPVALRDFPHPRHLCRNFPFQSTPHETYCIKCFCSVCEIPAPCHQWRGTNGHCNITKS